MDPKRSGWDWNCSVDSKLTRRSAVKLGLAAVITASGTEVLGLAAATADQASGGMSKSMNSKPHIAVVGAGAFGGGAGTYSTVTLLTMAIGRPGDEYVAVCPP